MNELEMLIKSQEEQEQMGNLTDTGIAYLNGLRAAMKIAKNAISNPLVGRIVNHCEECSKELKSGTVFCSPDCRRHYYSD